MASTSEISIDSSSDSSSESSDVGYQSDPEQTKYELYGALRTELDSTGTLISISKNTNPRLKYTFRLSLVRDSCAVLRKASPHRIHASIQEVVGDGYGGYMRSTLMLGYQWLKKSPADDPLSLPAGYGGEPEAEAKEKVFKLVELYGIACQLGCDMLQNDILDAFQARPTCRDSFPSRQFIKAVYQHAPKYSLLRRYVIDTYVYKSANWSSARKRELRKHHTAFGNTALLEDVRKTEKLLAASPSYIEREDPNDRRSCHYHYHPSKKACSHKPKTSS